MKKKNLSTSQGPTDYEVGLVSGSLSKSGSGPGSGSLSALFTTSGPSSALFSRAPEVIKPVEPRENPKPSPDIKIQTQKRVQTKQTAAQTKIQAREQGLLAADETEAPVRSKKRRLPPVGDQEEKRLPPGGDQEKRRLPPGGDQKKRRLPPGGDQDEVEFWVKRRQKLKENKQRRKDDESRTVFVGNLPLSCTKKTLRLLFKDKGPIESIRFRSLVREDPSMSRKVAAIMRKAHPQKQSINAYVVFKEEQSVASAIDRNGLELEPDLFIRVDRVSGSASHDHKRSVFVGNLPFDLKEALLRRHFSDCGPIEGVRLIRDPQTGLGKGFGYLLFQSTDSVQLALELDGSSLEGRSIRVKRSVHNDKVQSKERPGKNSRRRELPPKPGRSRPGTRPASRPGTRPGAKPGTKPGTRPGTKPGTKPGQFRGEMADPTKKKKTFLKKKKKKKKPVQKK